MSDWGLDPLLQRLKKRGVIDQREHIPARRKKVTKEWVVCWQWGLAKSLRLRDRVHRRAFSTEQLAVSFMEKEKRRFNCHPWTGQVWGPATYWIERNGVTFGDMVP